VRRCGIRYDGHNGRVLVLAKFIVQPVDHFVGKLMVVLIDDAALHLELGASAAEHARACFLDGFMQLGVKLAAIRP
jgi:hypothetical protein